MLKIYSNPDSVKMNHLTRRPANDSSKMQKSIDKIFERVSKEGDSALRDFSRKFDRVSIKEFRVAKDEINLARSQVPEKLQTAILRAYENIYQFHDHQKLEINPIQTEKGVFCWQESVAIESIGIYIPGGTAPLFSTVLMLAIPASIAGCDQIVLCTPPGINGQIHPAVLFAADVCEVHHIYKLGGAHAVAAMSIGTESIQRVLKIFGPGNQYVTAAKIKAFQAGTAIDLPAGPSEVLIFADHTADPDFVASDLLAQAEHGSDSQVVLVSDSMDIIKKVNKALPSQLECLPRKKIARDAMGHSFAVHFHHHMQAFDFINNYAPEHLIIASEHYENYKGLVRNAGSVFLGNYTPESAGDYASGTNHTLPTSGFAKAFSGVNLDAFVKKITFQQITREGIKRLGPCIRILAEAEMLQAHANSVIIRTDRI